MQIIHFTKFTIVPQDASQIGKSENDYYKTPPIIKKPQEIHLAALVFVDFRLSDSFIFLSFLWFWFLCLG